MLCVIPLGNRKQLIKKVVNQIAEACHPQKIILFGSYAYGKPNEDSDVDFLVIQNSKKRPADRAIAVFKSIHFYPFPMDIIVRTPKEIRHRLQMGDSFYQEIMTKGLTLYEH